MTILDRHLALALLGAAALTAVVLMGLSGFVTFVEELDWARRNGFGLSAAAWLTLYRLPELLFEMFPLVVLLGAILGLGGLASAGELVVMQGAGMSLGRLAGSVAVVGLLLGLASLVLGDRLVPHARAAEAALKSGNDTGTMPARGLWLRDGERFVHIARVADPRNLEAVRIFEIAADGRRLEAVQFADNVSYATGTSSTVSSPAGGWMAHGWRREQPGEDRLLFQRQDLKPLAFGFGPDVIELFLLRADSLSLPGLLRYIRYLEHNKLDAHRPRLEFWRKLAAPLSVVAMVLIAVPFVLGPLRDTGAGQRLFIGVLMGIGFYVFNEAVVSMGMVYRWPPLLAAFTPVLALLVLASWRLQRHRVA